MKIGFRSPIILERDESFDYHCLYIECGQQFATSQALGAHRVKTHKERSRNEIRKLIKNIREKRVDVSN